jgi:hypothetical protein
MENLFFYAIFVRLHDHRPTLAKLLYGRAEKISNGKRDYFLVSILIIVNGMDHQLSRGII